MKKINYLYLFTLISFGLADYTIQNPPHLGILWQDVEMINDSSAIAVGYSYSNGSGIISRTADLGQTWNHQYYGGGVWGEIDLKDVEFLDEQNGWAAGASGNLLRTWNGGDFWVFSEIPTNADLTTLQFVNDQLGYLGANQGWQNYEIYKTTDGGGVWEYIAGGPSRINKLEFINEEEGWAATTGNNIQHTTDGGISWFTIIVEEDFGVSWSDIDFIDENYGWAATSDGCIDASCGWQYRTIDGGQTWQNLSEGWWTNYIPKIGFFDTVHGWGIQFWYNGWGGGYGTLILNTTEAGVLWERVKNLYSQHIRAADFYNDQYGIAVGDRGLSLYSGDSNETWEANVYTGDVNSIFFIHENLGWASGRDGVLLKTEDGLSWVIQEMEIEMPENYWESHLIKDIYFPSENVGFLAVGNDGIYKSMDGGVTWQNVFLEEYFIEKVWFANEETGWFLAEGQYTVVIFHTADGGNSWNEQLSFDSFRVDLNDFQFLNSDIGWVVGRNSYLDQGLFCFTDDGGDSWLIEYPNQFQNIKNVHFTDDATGWIITNNLDNPTYYDIYKTETNGLNWVSQYELTYFSHSEMDFSDHLNGVVVNNNSNEIYHTYDGGNSWQAIEPDIGYGLTPTDCAIVNPGELWVSAHNGIILKYDVEPEIIPGDTNFDGEINVLDVMVIVNIILDDDGTEFEILASDINQDDLINIQDILLIVQIILNEQD